VADPEIVGEGCGRAERPKAAKGVRCGEGVSLCPLPRNFFPFWTSKWPVSVHCGCRWGCITPSPWIRHCSLLVHRVAYIHFDLFFQAASPLRYMILTLLGDRRWLLIALQGLFYGKFITFSLADDRKRCCATTMQLYIYFLAFRLIGILLLTISDIVCTLAS